MRPRILGLAVVLVGALVAVFALAGQAQAGGRIPTPPLTTAPDLYVTVNVTMTNTKFVLSVHAAPRGADARFVIHNVSNKPNTFVVGKPNVGTGTGVQTGFSATVKPGRHEDPDPVPRYPRQDPVLLGARRGPQQPRHAR